MTAVTSVLVNGVPFSATVQDLVPSEIAKRYAADILVLQTSLFITINGKSTGGTLPLTPTTQGNVETAINDLKSLMSGLTLPVDPSDPNSITKTYYMTTDMLGGLNALFKSLSFVISPSLLVPTSTVPIVFPSLADAQKWQDIVAATGILQSLFNAPINSRSFQAMVELDYVKTGNEVLSAQMSKLQNSLTITQNALDNLGNLQSLHNNIVVDNKSGFSAITGFQWNKKDQSASAFQNLYTAAASAFYKQPLSPRIAAQAGDSYVMNDSTITQMVASMQGPNPSSFNGNIGNFDATPASNADGLLPTYNFAVLNITPSQSFLTQYGLTFGGQAGSVKFYTTSNPTIMAAVNTLRAAVLDTQNYTTTNVNGIVTIKPNNVVDPKGAPIMDYLGAIPSSVLTPNTGSIAQLIAYRSALSTQITNLTAQNGGPTVAIVANSLLDRLTKVLADIDKYFKTSTNQRPTSSTTAFSAFSGFYAWMIDSYNQRTNAINASQAGQIQQNLTFAITTAQSTNTSQQNSVRQFLYVFEEYYKSASAILQQLTDMINRMAQGIAR